jgi:predicted ArsR family transcriptional regulator
VSGRPLGPKGAAIATALRTERIALTANDVARRFQLSRRDATLTLYNLRIAGYVVAVGKASGTGRPPLVYAAAPDNIGVPILRLRP